MSLALMLAWLSGGVEDQPRDFVGMRDQREMAGLEFDGLGAHPFGHEALEVRIDGAVFRGNGVVLDRHAACVVLPVSSAFWNGSWTA